MSEFLKIDRGVDGIEYININEIVRMETYVDKYEETQSIGIRMKIDRIEEILELEENTILRVIPASDVFNEMGKQLKEWR